MITTSCEGCGKTEKFTSIISAINFLERIKDGKCDKYYCEICKEKVDGLRHRKVRRQKELMEQLESECKQWEQELFT